MLPSMAAPTRSKRPSAPRKPARSEGRRKPAAQTLAEIARDAADEAQRRALRDALDANGYSPTAVGLALGIGGGSAGVLRILKRLGMLEAYEAERRRRGLKPGPQPA
jgi:hypothetical protein